MVPHDPLTVCNKVSKMILAALLMGAFLLLIAVGSTAAKTTQGKLPCLIYVEIRRPVKLTFAVVDAGAHLEDQVRVQKRFESVDGKRFTVQMYNTETNLKDLKEQKKKQRLNQVDLQELAEREEEA